MSLEKSPSGSRGARTPPHLLNRIFMPLMVRIHRRSGDRYQGMELLYLTTVGARSGQRRTNPVTRFDDGHGGWFIVASSAGSAQHPGWYHHIAAAPDQVWVEVSGVKHHVTVEQLTGEPRERAWARIIERWPRYQGYSEKTDRELPVLDLTPRSDHCAAIARRARIARPGWRRLGGWVEVPFPPVPGQRSPPWRR